MRIRLWRLHHIRTGSFNCHISRPADEVRESVEAFAKAHRLHLLALQEVSTGAARELAKISGWKVVGFDPGCGTAIMARRWLKISRVEVVPLGTETWPFRDNDHHEPRKMIVCVVEDWLRFGSLHLVPAPIGGVRLKQYNIGMELLRDYLNGHRDLPASLTGDWNKTVSEVGKYTPRWLANVTNSVIWPTREVCFPLTRRVKLTDLQVLNEGGSDHELTIFKLHKI